MMVVLFRIMIPVSQPTLPSLDDVHKLMIAPFDDCQITNGRLVKQFENHLTKLIGVKHVVATSSNTLGMLLTWKSFNFPVGSEVILPSFTFPASAHALIWNNLKPVFVDVEPSTYLIDAQAIEGAITSKTVAILGVTLWGNACNHDALQQIANNYKLALIYDSAQGMGVKYNGRYLGDRGDAEIFSFSPTKLITTCEGGAVATNNKQLADFIRLNRNYGLTPQYDSPSVGLNARMSEMHAAIGLSCFETMPKAIEHRLNMISIYKDELSKLPGITFQKMTDGCHSNGVYFGIFIDRDKFGMSRDDLSSKLQALGVQTRKYGSPALHELMCYTHLSTPYLPVTNRAAQEVLVLPIFSHITESQVYTVTSSITDIYNSL